MRGQEAIRWIRERWTYGAMLALGVFLMSCNSAMLNGNDSTSSRATKDTTSGSVAGTTDQATSSNGARRGEEMGNAGTSSARALNDNTVDVTMTETGMQVPRTIPAGMVRILVKNDGTSEHNFAIDGNGNFQQLGANLEPGGSAVLELSLTPGSYDLYDPLGSNRDHGVSAKLTVGHSK